MTESSRHHGTRLLEVKTFSLKTFRDERGFFCEIYNAEKENYKSGMPQFCQDNFSFSTKGVLRGLHFQRPNQQGKLITILKGEIFDVAVDIRPESRTFGEWMAVDLTAESTNQMWIPPGFAHGFQVISPDCYFIYKCTDYYRPEHEHTLLWNDNDLGISWPNPDSCIISEKDQKGLSLAEMKKTMTTT